MSQISCCHFVAPTPSIHIEKTQAKPGFGGVERLVQDAMHESSWVDMNTAQKRIDRRRRGSSMVGRRRRIAIGSLLMTTARLIGTTNADAMAATPPPASISCLTAEGRMEEVPASRINDGYCDCWATGQDETTTDACAGVDYWGWAMLSGTAAADDDVPDEIQRPYFTCPDHQPDTAPLAVSRVHDGICDCCDGSDESAVSSVQCPDTCAAILAAALAEKTALAERYEKGSALRQAAIDAYQQYKAESLLELEALQTQVTAERAHLEMSRSNFSSAKLDFAQQRLDRMARSSDNDGSLTGLTDVEWKHFIVHACQLAGEMSTDGTQCEALQLAALDAGLGLESTLTTEELANLLYHNANNNPNDRIWKVADLPKTSSKKKKKNKGRRLMRVVAAEEDYAVDDEDVDNYYEEQHFDDDHDSRSEDAAVAEPSDERTAIERHPFSASRVAFLAQASRLLQLVEEASTLRNEETKSDEEISGLEPDEVERRAKVKELLAMEDKAVDLLKATLTDRKRVVDRGFDYALSAQTALEAISDDTILKRLALGTVYHGKLSAIHVYQILAAMLLSPNEDSDIGAQSCPSTVARMCPPKTIVRGADTIPSKLVIDAVESFCNNGTELPDLQASCLDVDAIPTEIFDGFAGYYEMFPRDEGDQWEKFLDTTFALTNEESARLVALAETEESVEAASKKIKELEKTIKNLKGSIGTDDESKYGPEGELHSIRDECFSVKAGKYTYELCMYKKASQKDGGSSTNLGNWVEATVETIDDRLVHVWKWDRGAKCWNGPMRSATAHVTCGTETVVLSADEPDTCRYVFQVQSPTACDEAFKTRHSL